MSGYLLGVIGTVLLCTLLTALAPEGKTSSVIKGVARLGCILAIISPVLQFLKSGSIQVFNDKNNQNNFSQTVIDKEDDFIQYYSEWRVRASEDALKRELTEKFVEPTSVIFSWSIEERTFGKGYAVDEIRIERISLTLPKETSEEVIEKMSLYIAQNYCSEVLIE